MGENPLAERIAAALGEAGITRKKMFGGTCFLLDGNMVAATPKGELLVRVGKDGAAAALARPHARPMEHQGRIMSGYVIVAAPGFASDAALRAWLDMAAAHVATLPPKPAAPAGKRPGNARKAP